MPQIGKKEALYVAKKMKPELIHNLALAEGTSLTYIETKTLIVDRVTPNGKSVEDVEQALRLGRAYDEIISQVEYNTFKVDKENFILINCLVAEHEALRVGAFRNGQVFISDYTPPQPDELGVCFTIMLAAFEKKQVIEEKASDLFLDSARNQYFFDGNKRTAQLMMNGFLLSHGFAPRSILQGDLPRYNEMMMRFYHSNDKREMYVFLTENASSARYRI